MQLENPRDKNLEKIREMGMGLSLMLLYPPFSKMQIMKSGQTFNKENVMHQKLQSQNERKNDLMKCKFNVKLLRIYCFGGA